nr:NmrA family NAD(P)-binding protein [Salsipaludibacter albus]
MGPVVVTGATGNLGGAVATSLAAAGHVVRAGLTDPARWHDDSIAPVHLDLTDAATFPAAMTGASALFLMRPPAIARVGPTLNRLVDAAVDAGVAPVVFASVAGADSNRVVPHHRVETHLQAAGIAHTILRPGFFAQNLGDAYRADIRTDDRLYVPAGDGRVAFLDVRDLGDVTATILADPGAHAGRSYHLTGPAAVTFVDVADLLSRRLGRPIHYHPASVVGYLGHLRRSGLPVAQVVVQTVLHVGLRRGDAAPVTSTLADLLGRPARTLDDYVTDHLDLWSTP